MTSLAPQWKVAHLLGSHDSVKVKEARAMMWVLKVNYREATERERTRLHRTEQRASAILKGLYRVASIEVLQSSNATSARLWAEDGIGLTKGKERENEEGKKEKGAATDSASGGMGGEVGEEQDESEQDPFIANIPKDWSLSDCIVDKSKFKTIEEQRVHFENRMLEMARAGHDEEDGWKFYCKTNSATVAELQQYVSWKKRYRYTWSSQFEVQLTRHFFDLITPPQTRYLAARRAVVLGEAAEDSVGDGV